MCIYTYALCMYVCMYVCMYIYIYIYIYRERDMYTYIHMNILPPKTARCSAACFSASRASMSPAYF